MSVSWQSGPPSFGDPVVWPSGSTVCVTGDLNVSDLTIEPGVQVACRRRSVSATARSSAFGLRAMRPTTKKKQ